MGIGNTSRLASTLNLYFVRFTNFSGHSSGIFDGWSIFLV